MRPTDRDLSAVLAGLALGALIRNVGAHQTRWALAATGILTFALTWWMRQAWYCRRRQYQASCDSCHWQTSNYDHTQDACSAARAHAVLGNHHRPEDPPLSRST